MFPVRSISWNAEKVVHQRAPRVVPDIRGEAVRDVFLGDADLCSTVHLWGNQRLSVHLLQVHTDQTVIKIKTSV